MLDVLALPISEYFLRLFGDGFDLVFLRALAAQHAHGAIGFHHIEGE